MQANRVNWLYVLRLQDDHYYVGTTTDLSKRFDEHWSGKGAVWTTKHPPMIVVSVDRGKTTFDEDTKVKELMSIFGISKVRGGSYSQCELSQEQIKLIEREINHGKGGCLKCGSNDHWIKDCTKAQAPAGCTRCGRNTHTEDKCYAKKHLNGSYLKSNPKSDGLMENFMKLIIEE